MSTDDLFNELFDDDELFEEMDKLIDEKEYYQSLLKKTSRNLTETQLIMYNNIIINKLKKINKRLQELKSEIVILL